MSFISKRRALESLRAPFTENQLLLLHYNIMITSLLLKFRKLSNLRSASAYLRVITRSKAVNPTDFLRARYPHPKSLPSGKGLAFALSGSKSGVSQVVKNYPPIMTVSPAITMETMLMSLIRMFNDGPDVSLNGSPTVSPTIVAL